MKLKSQLIISIGILGAILLIIFSSYIFTNQQVNQLNSQEQIVRNIQTGANDLSYLSDDFFLYQESSQATLFHTKISSLTNDLSKFNPANPTQATLVKNTKSDLNSLDSVFGQAVSFLENSPRNVSVRVLPAFQTAWSRLAAQSETLTHDSAQLSQILRDQSDQLKQTNSMLVFAMVGAFAVYFVTIYFLVFKRTFRSIAKLQGGTKIIGSGNLDYSIAAKSNDEIGELSRAFDQMTTNLKTVTASKTDLEQAQASLRTSEQRWATTLASIGDAVIATDTLGKIVFMNGEAEELTGWTLSDASQLPLRTVFNIINEQSRLEVESPTERVLREGIVVGLANHTVLIRKDGAEVPIDDSGAPIKDKEGKTTGVVLIFRDIIERKKAEEAIVYQANLLSNAHEAIFGTDAKYNITYWNKGAEELLGWTKDEAIRKNVQELVPAKLEGSTREEESAIAATTGHWEGEVQYRRKDGSYVSVELNSSSLRSPDGNLLGFVTAARDITERKKSEEAKARQAELIDLSPDAIIVRKLDGTINFWSKGAEKLYGWSKDEAVGQNINTLLKTELPQSLEEIQNTLKMEGKWSGEIVHICKDGSRLVVQSFWLGKFGSDGKIFEVLESNVDITQRIQMQFKLEESAVRLEEYANQMESLANQRAAQLKDAERLATIGATAGMVGHDIRNPLQAITGDLFLAKTDLIAIPESEEKKNIQESLTEIEKNIVYINKIVADLQDFARPLKPNAEETDLKQIIDDLLSKNGLPENVKVSVKVETGKIVADSTFINRIMYNLVNNAVQAMPKGGKLTIRTYKEANDTIISVKDTGVGIPEVVKGKLFTPMFTTKSKGQGFGLAVIKRMTEALGGTVSFESQEGKGTTFKIRLPQK